jgi:uncharacterized protein (TIGR02001 family)
MKKAFALFALWLASAVPAFAGEITGSVTLTSEYVYRGISQTQEDIAVQGAINIGLTKGWYLNLWGSNVDFGGDAQAEVDVYLGRAGARDSGLKWDFGLLYYAYPSESDLDFLEIYGGVGWKTVMVKYSYSDDFAGTDDDGHYFEINYDQPFADRYGLVAHAGYSLFGDGVGLEDYSDYRLGLYATVSRLTFDLSFYTTDEKQLGNLDDERVVFSLTYK